MKYFLLIFIASGHPSYTQVGPFSSVLACERAAGQAQLIVPRDRRGRPWTEVHTVCVSTQIESLALPKEKKHAP